jgi:orotidine-5'-phosphate decarboxylase
MTENPIIVALDVDSAAEARSLVDKLGDRIGFYKVGLELHAASGMEIVRELQDEGKDVFLDLKLFDIGETVKRAVAVIARTGVRFLSLHSSAAVMRAAVEGRGEAPLQLLAVTVLTSFDDEDVHDLGYSGTAAELVQWRVRKSVESGVDGLIASALDAAIVRRLAGPGKLIVTPGVRSAGKARGDQKRVATPGEAIRNGANYVVIGRQITRAADPAEEAARVLEEIRGAALPAPSR